MGVTAKIRPIQEMEPTSGAGNRDGAEEQQSVEEVKQGKTDEEALKKRLAASNEGQQDQYPQHQGT